MEKKQGDSKQSTGRHGEELATEYLAARGYRLLARNWRYQRSEIDLIAAKDHCIHFIEVKTLHGNQFSMPEYKVNKAKLRMLKAGAEGYLLQHPEWKWIQFDIVAITLFPHQPPDIFLIADIS
ncbi:MAG: YraN family protein [Chitinophagaceae bacterium]|nr:YraN family protein [Chitinophagaceae bacterium]